jgi:hypothetical protein
MSYLIDDIARTLAGPMPRRNALRLMSGLLLGALGVKRAAADDDAEMATCTNPRCTSTQHCCRGFNRSNFCLSTSLRCCGNLMNCPTTQVCCGSGTRAVCCGKGQRCDDGRCSASNRDN